MSSMKGHTRHSLQDPAKLSRKEYNVSPHSDPATTWVNTSHLATKVQQRISELQAEYKAHAVVSANDILENLKDIGFADLSGQDIRPSNKVAALDKMAKMLGMYRDDPKDRDNQPVQITKVTVVLTRKEEHVATESREIVDGTSRMLDSSEEE